MRFLIFVSSHSRAIATESVSSPFCWHNAMISERTGNTVSNGTDRKCACDPTMQIIRVYSMGLFLFFGGLTEDPVKSFHLDDQLKQPIDFGF